MLQKQRTKILDGFRILRSVIPMILLGRATQFHDHCCILGVGNKICNLLGFVGHLTNFVDVGDTLANQASVGI